MTFLSKHSTTLNKSSDLRRLDLNDWGNQIGSLMKSTQDETKQLASTPRESTLFLIIVSGLHFYVPYKEVITYKWLVWVDEVPIRSSGSSSCLLYNWRPPLPSLRPPHFRQRDPTDPGVIWHALWTQATVEHSVVCSGTRAPLSSATLSSSVVSGEKSRIRKKLGYREVSTPQIS